MLIFFHEPLNSSRFAWIPELRHALARHQPTLVGHLVDHRKPAPGVGGRVDHHGDHGNVPAHRPEAFTVRAMVSVEAPQPSQDGGAGDALRRAGAGSARCRGAGPRGGPARRIHGELLRIGARRGVAGLLPCEAGQRAPVALEDPRSLERQSSARPAARGARAAQRRSAHDRRRSRPSAAPARCLRRSGPVVARREPSVHAQQHARTGDTAAVEKIHDRHVGRPATDPLLAPEEDRELDRGRLGGQLRGPSARRCSTCTLSSVVMPVRLISMTSSTRARMGCSVSTASATIGRSSESVSSRSLCRPCLTPKPSIPRNSALARTACRSKTVDQRIREQPPAGAIALAEVGRQPQSRPRSSAASEHPPERRAPTPSTRLSDDVRRHQPALTVLGEAMGLEHPCRERRV